MNKRQSPALYQVIALSYDSQAASTLSARGDAELAKTILAIARGYEIPIYENAELVHPLARPELGDTIPKAPYRTTAEITTFAWYLKGKCPEGFTPDAADGSEMLLLGGPGD